MANGVAAGAGAAGNNGPAAGRLLERESHVRQAALGGLEQRRGRNAYRMQLAVQIERPEIQKLVQDGEARRDIQFLPDIGLQDRRMIWHVIEDLGRRQPVVPKLLCEVTHDVQTIRSSFGCGTAAGAAAPHYIVWTSTIKNQLKQ